MDNTQNCPGFETDWSQDGDINALLGDAANPISMLAAAQAISRREKAAEVIVPQQAYTTSLMAAKGGLFGHGCIQANCLRTRITRLLRNGNSVWKS